MARFIVTGAAGFIGSHLVDRLLAEGHNVVGIDAFTTAYDPEIKHRRLLVASSNPRFTLLDKDLLTVRLAHLLPVDGVFHLAAQAGVRDSWGTSFRLYLERNLAATQHLLEELTDSKATRIVYASTSSVYGDVPLPMEEDGPTRPVSPYGVTKLAAEHLLGAYGRTYGIPFVILRYFTVYGPRQRPDMAIGRFVHAISNGDPIQIYGDGSQRRDFTYVHDVVDATLRAFRAPVEGMALNVGSGHPITLTDLIADLEHLLGKNAPREFLPQARGDAAETLAATEKARRLLGFTASTSLEEGLAGQINWQARG